MASVHSVVVLSILAACATATAEPARVVTVGPSAENADIARHRQGVADLRSRYGAHDVRVAEGLVSLGRAERAAGETGSALRSFQEAMQLHRVNAGLHDPGQLDLLERIIETQAAAGDWQGVDDSFHYLHWVARRNVRAGDPAEVAILDRVARWHVQALRLSTGTAPYQHLLRARELSMRAVAAAEQAWGTRDQRLMGTLLNAAAINLEVTRAVYARFEAVQREYFEHDRNEHVDSERMQLNQFALAAYRDGKALLQRVVDLHDADPTLSAASRARALLFLGDWHLVNEERKAAQEAYRRAYEVLATAGATPSELEAMFGAPRPLPAWEIAPAVKPLASARPAAARVVVNYAVSERGRPERVEVSESESAGDDGLQRSARELLSTTLFRPRLDRGMPVAAPDLRQELMIPGQ